MLKKPKTYSLRKWPPDLEIFNPRIREEYTISELVQYRI